MADLTQTAANVASGASTLQTKMVQYGEAVTQGMPLYKSTSDSKWYQCDADDQTKSRVEAIALTPGSTDGYGLIAQPATTYGKALVNLGATLAVGTAYAVSSTKGAICPISDLGSGKYISIIGVATTTALLDFQVSISNTAKA